jgi:hypothetical protein
VAFALQAALQHVGLPRRVVLPAAPWTLVLGAAAAVGISAAVLSLPRSGSWPFGMFLAALACVPWFAYQLRSLQRASGIADAPA